MSGVLKSFRHPDFSATAELWEYWGNKINMDDTSVLSDIPEFSSVRTKFQNKEKRIDCYSFDYIAPSLEIIGAHAIRSFCKSLESLDATFICSNSKVTNSAIVTSYNASFFAAKSLCYLLGFSPLNRDSNITIDAFYELDDGKSNRAFRYDRWGHAQTWALTTRLVDTLRVTNELKETKRYLRKMKLAKTSKVRNSFSYADNIISPIGNGSASDFPDNSEISPSEEERRYVEISKAILKLSSSILISAKVQDLLLYHTTERRLELAA